MVRGDGNGLAPIDEGNAKNSVSALLPAQDNDAIAGRPPLPPTSSPQLVNGEKNDHKREESTGAQSLVSALTEDSNEDVHAVQSSSSTGASGSPNPILNHKVSWSDTVIPEVDTAVPAPPPDETSPLSASPKRSKVLSVADLHAAGPLESEAETSVLQAIEDREGQDRSSKVTSTILPNIPDSFSQSLRSSNQNGPGNQHNKPQGSREPGWRHHRRLDTEDEGTLKSNLKELTHAMRDMHEQSIRVTDTNDAAQAHYHHRLPSRDETIVSIPRAVHNGDSLVQHANILFRRRRRCKKEPQSSHTTEEDQDERRHASNIHWNIHEGDSKESDGNPPEVVTGNPKSDGGDSHEHVDTELGNSDVGSDESNEGTWRRLQRRVNKVFVREAHTSKDNMTSFSDFIEPKKRGIIGHAKTALFFFILPALGVSVLLFYAFGNPMMKRGGASISWFLLFLVRQVITLGLAKLTELFLVDYLTLQMIWTIRLFGRFGSLCLTQSHGFPFIFSFWSIYDFILLSGSNAFVKHWLFWQNAILLMNASNPAGTITESTLNSSILGCALGFGVAVTFKRVFLGLRFGKRTYLNYGDDLAKLMQKVLLVSEVATWAKDIENGRSLDYFKSREAQMGSPMKLTPVNSPQYDDEAASPAGAHSLEPQASGDKVIDDEKRDKYTGSLTQSQKNKVRQYLEDWEEPETGKKSTKDEEVSIDAILQFRQALTLITNDYPFSVAFGLADTREDCVQSAQQVYERLMLYQPDGAKILDFNTIALLATEKDGSVDSKKMKGLISLFRPDRNGHLSMLDFLKSVDSVYKQVRMLGASILNSGQIDQAAESIINVIFYTICLFVILSVLGFDPIALFVSLSSLIVAFAFMIGSAAAKYFEGILLIFVRRPFDIGDRISVSPVDQDTSRDGSTTWFVEKVDLFASTIRFALTNEVATVSNGSLANSRIINAARSPKMIVYVYMKFGVEVPYKKVKMFRNTMEQFVKKRPRDWLSMKGFRATRVEPDLGYIEYVMVLQHRDSWQNITPMQNAKAEFQSYALEAAKKLDMPYRAPPLPVDLNLANHDESRTDSAQGSSDGNVRRASTSDLSALFGETKGSTGTGAQS